VVERVTALAHSAVGARLAAMVDADEPLYSDAAGSSRWLSRQVP
jgi:hypothetical protein